MLKFSNYLEGNMKNRSCLKTILIALGAILILWILGTAVLLLVGPSSGGGPATDQTQAFLQTLKDGNYSAAYEFFSDNAKKEMKDPASFEEWIKRNDLQIKDWMPPMSRPLDNGAMGVVFTANLANGKQESLVVALLKSGDEWKINYFGRPPK
jgi:hypothetical protein